MMGFVLQNFPFQALGCNSMKDFYHEYVKEVVTVLYCNEPELLEDVSKTLEISVLDTVKVNISFEYGYPIHILCFVNDRNCCLSFIVEMLSGSYGSFMQKIC